MNRISILIVFFGIKQLAIFFRHSYLNFIYIYKFSSVIFQYSNQLRDENTIILKTKYSRNTKVLWILKCSALTELKSTQEVIWCIFCRMKLKLYSRWIVRYQKLLLGSLRNLIIENKANLWFMTAALFPILKLIELLSGSPVCKTSKLIFKSQTKSNLQALDIIKFVWWLYRETHKKLVKVNAYNSKSIKRRKMK